LALPFSGVLDRGETPSAFIGAPSLGLFHRFTGSLMLVALIAAAHGNAQSLPSETDRLVSTARLWITVKYFSPSLAYRDLDWDQALVDSLPKIRSAQTAGDYEAAIRSMMRGLEGSGSASGSAPVSGVRIWIHHGLPPEAGQPSNHFYSAFLYKAGNLPDEVGVPMGGFSVNVPLSEAAMVPAIPSPAPARIYREAYPATELRILAACKVWGVFHYFFAYRDLMDEDWDSLLTQFLPRLIAAKDALEYNLAIAEWLTHTADSLAAMDSETMTHYFGEAPLGLRLRVVEKHAVITEVLDAAAIQAGIRVGDVVKKIDGEILVDRFKRLAQYVSASTPQRLAADVAGRILSGPDGSNAAVTLEDHAGNRKEVTLKRSKRFADPIRVESSIEPLKVLRGGIGYADLRTLKRQGVEAMFEKFRAAPAIVFDMRGLPADDSIAAIAPRLTAEPDVPAAIVTGPIAAAPDLQQGSIAGPSSSYFFIQTIGNSAAWKYLGKTAMLVDERTWGEGEQAALFLEAANKTEFIGAPSAGANSVLTNFTIPGGITISLSGEDIRHANGGKLQRMGLQPNVSIAPTLTGIRTGKDEVLEKALDYLSPKVPAAKTQPARAGLKYPRTPTGM
jgi:C-terminal processing protease CtpA/Prc